MVRCCIALSFLVLPAIAAATPDFSQRLEIDGITVVRDREAPGTFYFLPNALEIAESEDGGPELAFTLAVYTGTTVHGDQGDHSIRASFYARVRRIDHDPRRYQNVADELARRFGPRTVLREIPISRVDAKLVYADVDGVEQTAGEGFFEPVDSERRGTIWQERDMFLTLDPAGAQLLEELLENGDPGISLSYAFYTRAWTAAESDGELSTDGFDATAIEEALESAPDTADPQPSESMVRADAIPIRIAEPYRASRLERYHLESTLPPDYASLVVYCFDFRNELRDDLFEKAVVIEASGVAGGTTRHLAVFSSDAPEIYAQTVRFPFAVDLRKPYRWRAEEVLATGEFQVSNWTESTSWADPIDATGDVTAWNDEPDVGDEGDDL